MPRVAKNERNAMIVEARRGKRTYASIANDHDISRERVRQILLEAGDPALLGFRNLGPPMKPGRCIVCSGEVAVSRSANSTYYVNKFCSPKCREMDRFERYHREKFYIVLRARKNGSTWAVASKLIGSAWPSVAYAMMKRNRSRLTPDELKIVFSQDKGV